MLSQLLTESDAFFENVLKSHRVRLRRQETGRLLQIEGDIAKVSGLPGIKSMEILRFQDRSLGMAFNLDRSEIGVVMLGNHPGLKAGSEVRRSGSIFDVPVGPGLLGRIVDALGNPLDGGPAVPARSRWPIERAAPEIMDRAPVSVPLETGIKIIDSLIPVGRGQRQLILGDRQTGKTAIAVDTILNQRDKGVLCVYCSIGQRGSAVARVIETLRSEKALDHCVLVVASGDDSAGMQYVAPYAATTIAEYFMEQGQDVLIVYDDLTRHAHAYRELSLLLRRPPGREAYPGDIFYIHSRLLERSTHLKSDAGGGSLTALPIIETQAQNLSAYIPTNLISITDGQIYLSPDLYQQAQLPAVDAGKSVSRVGGKAQLPALLAVAGELKLAYTQFHELETFARFGTRLDEQTRRVIERGRRIREILKQPERESFSAADQVTIFLAANHGLFDRLPLDRVKIAEQTLKGLVERECGPIYSKIQQGGRLDDEERATLLERCRTAIHPT
ncbi:MAG: alternate F1F0 ATPase, F1 subunit alpha [Gammaproteobacteria bacterium]